MTVAVWVLPKLNLTPSLTPSTTAEPPTVPPTLLDLDDRSPTAISLALAAEVGALTSCGPFL